MRQGLFVYAKKPPFQDGFRHMTQKTVYYSNFAVAKPLIYL